MSKVYLSGASKNLGDEGKNWRDGALTLLNREDGHFDVFFPNNFYNYSTLYPKTTKECRKYFMHNLKNSDVVLLNLDYTDLSVGTGFEIAVADELGIPIIGFGNTEVYEWTQDCCWVIFDTMEEAIEYIYIYF